MQQREARRDRENRMLLDSAMAKGDTLYAQGQAVGRAGDETGCFDAHTDSMLAMAQVGSAMNSSDFLYGCLETAAKTPGFCQGVPKLAYLSDTIRAPAALAASDSFQHAHCADNPVDERACLVQARIKQLYCHDEGAFAPGMPSREERRRLFR